jgi:hypothetical protein
MGKKLGWAHVCQIQFQKTGKLPLSSTKILKEKKLDLMTLSPSKLFKYKGYKQIKSVLLPWTTWKNYYQTDFSPSKTH